MREKMKRITEAADWLRCTVGEADIGIVLGSGLGSYAEALRDRKVADYAAIPHFPRSTAPGHAGRWWSGNLNGRRVYMLQGRVHFYEGLDPFDITMYVRVMKLLGVKLLVLTNAAGCVNTAWQPGDLMLVKDFINFSGVNPLIGENLEEMGPRFPDMSCVCDEQAAEALRESAARRGFPLREGVYMWFSGPAYETPAEIRMSRCLGADAVGMSTVPELIVARHCGLRSVALSCLTNMAAGILPQPLDHREVEAVAAKAQIRFRALLGDLISGAQV